VTAAARPQPPPVVCSDARQAERLVAALVANRALGTLPPPLVLELTPDGELAAPAPPVADALAARELVLVATGAGRAAALRRVLSEPPDPAVAPTLLRAHPRLTVVCDPPATAALAGSPHHLADHVAIVLGHREPGISAEHRISVESLQRVQRAERLVHRRPTRAVVLTGFTATGGLSEAEQMALRWNESDVPCLLEVAGRDTAENATRSLPLVQALGGVRSVTVVTSAWHVRTPWFFAPYRRAGLRVAHRNEWRGPGWARLLASEAVKLPHAPGERRRAWRDAAGR
jgi:hypothetical protein